MKSDNVTRALGKFWNEVPQNKVEELRNCLEQAPDECFETLMGKPVKGKIKTILFSVFLGAFGVDRFYVRDKNKAIGKLVLNIFATVISLAATSQFGSLIGSLANLGIGIWSFVDIFFAYKVAQQINYDEIRTFLMVEIYKKRQMEKEEKVKDSIGGSGLRP